MGIRNSKHGGEHMRAVLAGDLNNVPIRCGFKSRKTISAGGKDLGGNARNFNRYGKGDNCISRLLLVGLCFRSNDKTEYGEAKCCSNTLEKFHFSPRVSPTNLHGGYDASSRC